MIIDYIQERCIVCGTTTLDKEQKKKNKEVNKQLKERKKELNQEIKLLLLGTGESGKSTFAKQMKILHTSGFSKQELISYKPVVWSNTITCMKILVQATKKLNFEINPENEEIAKYFEEINAVEIDSFDKTFSEKIKKLWNDPGIQKAYENRNQFQLMDSAKYCFENADRFATSDYTPTEEDILRVRVRTTGIIETQFSVKGTYFRLVDVGGQRSERKKWLHCFDDVTAIIYCVALNEYDMKLFEDERVNRMEESLELFEEVANSKWFTKTAILLFLNKKDLFEEKIKKVSLTTLFPDYSGGDDPAAGIEYIKLQFFALNRNEKKKIFAHVTCATDTQNVKVVFDDAKEIIISQNLERLGFGPL
jgi:GTPase SAR1 family protein